MFVLLVLVIDSVSVKLTFIFFNSGFSGNVNEKTNTLRLKIHHYSA